MRMVGDENNKVVNIDPMWWLCCVVLITVTLLMQIRWCVRTGGEIKAAPILEYTTDSSHGSSGSGSRVWFGSYDGLLYGINEKSGHQVVDPVVVGGSMFASPVVWTHDHRTTTTITTTTTTTTTTTGLVVCTTKGLVVCLEVKGLAVERHWERQVSTPIFATPLLLLLPPTHHHPSHPKAVVVASAEGTIYSFSLTNGDPLWQHETQVAIFSSPRFDGRKGWILIGSQVGRVHCLEAEKGKVVWEMDVGAGAVFATPWLCCSSGGDRDIVVVATVGGVVVVLEGSDGKIIAKAQCQGEIFSSPVVVDHTIIVGCRDDLVYTWTIL